MRKYILIPEFRPLYAMQRCFGPTHGPLERPTLTPVDVIGSLLKQSGNEKLTIYEVTKLDDHRFSEPVQLTLTNYKKPYEEILENPVVPGQTLEEVKPPKAVKPVPPPAPEHEAPVSTWEHEDPVPVEIPEVVEDKLRGETVVVVHPDEPSADEDQSDKRPDSDEDEGEAGEEEGEKPAEEPTEEPEAETKPDLPEALPGEKIIQAGPYAGLTQSQKKALKAAGKGLK